MGDQVPFLLLGFVGKVGLPALKGLLDDLWQREVLSTDDKDTVLEDQTIRSDRARCLIDMVMAKGERASLAMIDCMLERDRELYLTLGLILPPSPTDRGGSYINHLSASLLCLEEDKYPLTCKPTGLCLIINNENFQDGTKRSGTQKDDMFDAGDRMVPELQSQLLQRLKLVDLKFTPLSRHRCIRLGHGDAFVCCVLSHGDEDVVSGVDGKTLPIIDITSAFNGEHCPALIGKPKVFFIQACQGPNLHTGWTVDDLPFHWQKPKADKGRQTKKEHHPNEADYLVSKATVAKYPAFRDENTGSYFMQSLCKQLRMGCARGEDILKILVDVNADVSKEDFGQNCSEKQMLKQMPEFRVTLRHALVFSPCFRRET
uniref:Caspase-8 n=1 Tax=Gadus morhua TaxID=8049 RepID=A0A8C5BCN8_GADMO